MTNATTDFAIVNNTGSSNAYAYVTGSDINKDNALAIMQADGKTVYYPASPSGTGQALAADCAIPLGAPGSSTSVTVPQLGGGRIWFAIDNKLTFLLNPGPGLVEPSVTNEADPNHNVNWGFCEFTYDKTQLFVNITYVDMVSIPIALKLEDTSGAVQTVEGIPADGLETVCTQLKQQAASENADWGKLIVAAADGSNLRALSPNSGAVLDNSIFSGYYDTYVNQAWSKYTSGGPLKIDTQAQWGTVSGTTSGDTLSFGDGLTFAKPSAADIFSCSTGPFANYPAENAAQMGAIGARLSAALNRSTLLTDADQPDGETDTANFYKTSPTNHYARIVHAANLDGRGYAFPYDDVSPSGQTAPDQAGTVFDGAPKLLTITVGGPAASAAPNAGQDKKEGAEDGTKTKKDAGGVGDGKQDKGVGKKAGKAAALLQKIKGMFTSCFGGQKK